MSGVNALGIDEPRLRRFAADIARSGTPVLTPELPDLREYLVTAQLTDDIEDAALALLDADDVPSRDGRIGLLGISFSGGLAVVAAGRPTLRDRVAFVFTFGAHANLPRVSRYLSTGVLPDGSVLPPHDYGGVILLTNLADQVVPPAQVEPLRTAINRFLYASHVAMFDEKEAARQFGEAQRLAAELPAEAARLMHLVNTRDVDALGAVLLPHVDAGQADAALSPDQSPPPPAPVYLLHSAGDTVIPTSEALALAAHLTARGTPARVLVTPVLGHAELQLRLGARDVWDLLRFWSDMPW